MLTIVAVDVRGFPLLVVLLISTIGSGQAVLYDACSWMMVRTVGLLDETGLGPLPGLRLCPAR